MSIHIQQVNKHFGNFVAVDSVNLEIKTGELTALLGPSGSGKTTLLRIIAGLEQADSGIVKFNGEDITTQHVSERGVGFVFQHYALFKHMTVFENVAYGLTVRPRKTRPSKAEIAEKVHSLLKLVQLDWTADRYPSQLSGGQRQRIALARALAVEPKVLLLDEPFGALDAKVRAELRRWLRRLHDEINVTTVFVTHDQEEALEVADKIVVMNKGRIEQQGTPEEVYDTPSNPFVYEFLGNVNLFHARVKHGHSTIGNIHIPSPEHAGGEEQQGLAYVRPHEIEVLTQPTENAIKVNLDLVTIVGPVARLEVLTEIDEQLIHVELSKVQFKQLGISKGDNAWIQPRYSKVFLGEGI
ncbi:sulfate ABC transporter ATP-binding protein [Shewanella oneidensis MR-1]|uniref:Sulfate/thiosulfate import ATP-binding protein CysA 2 n=1 Tax=Shewanella oneidensis (strain ATCC 700550 / JCM 31522 / CIP 106686 / LMG 19005 / NCIMB 14063 / MR-1) TaxID=211586 RepID=CYSA2_SHEON|nr:sulfate ABC transporter ATP-binding protein [Shewanella oneidensis]Q8E8K8.1 RecName: Full=Sulfate/thiosulfate import ATP-binding protein CysA 2; AltName: Full=Sulfate-transporting ATPase 2 [Shewanella oneidensis MR-1]AAN57615.1 ABC-type sulfate/thiosulfate uptakesystem ATPase component CysA [Shewanella oneidensis MR-1]MDX5998106.1 sulfate ABC transporter ATP-binding protein [Shewanella oneidensis]MEE2026715.1 Sulfate/thiosulfate import ATP-binding protein CysA [Shewanella oneidensis]QKG9490